MTKVIDSSGLIPCEHERGETCKYRLLKSSKIIEKACVCSFNAEGSSYCEKDHNGIIYNDKTYLY